MQSSLLKKAEKLLEDALSFVANQQNSDGSFTSLSSPTPDNFTDGKECLTTFQTSLILGALSGIATRKIAAAHFDNSHVGNSTARTICKKAAAFLVGEKSATWSWNYWARASPEAKERPYPDDLDDTFLALSALQTFDQKLVGPKGLAHAIKLLIKMEITEGGPYRTWLTAESERDLNADIAVNANIAYFLSLHNIRLPALTDLLEKSIRNNSLGSPYYPSIYQTAYFISRSYQGPSKLALIESIERREEKEPDTVLSLSLKLSTLTRLKAPEEKILRCLKRLLSMCAQKEPKRYKGHPKKYRGKYSEWKAEAFCIDPARNGERYYGGSAALTGAIVAEALSLFLGLFLGHQKETTAAGPGIMKSASTKTSTNVTESASIQEQIISDTKKLFSALTKKSQEHVSILLDSITKNGARNETALLPYFFAKSLTMKMRKNLRRRLSSLGTASLCGWLAYSILDDFLDETGESELLIPALICLRELDAAYMQSLQSAPALQKIFKETMCLSDQAHDWEIKNCRFVHHPICKIPAPVDFGDFSMLAEKSLGHALGPIAVLLHKGDALDVKKAHRNRLRVTLLLNLFRHYLIARQLNDDVHDWQEDLEGGRLTPATTLLFQEWSAQHAEAKSIDFKKSLPKLRELFWEKVIPVLCETIIDHCGKAENSLIKLRLDDPNYFFDLINHPKSAALKALYERTFLQELTGGGSEK